MTAGPSLDAVADLMARFRQGDSSAAGRLVEIFHPELRRLAAARMRGERSDHTWQPTVLVNELYLRLVRINALRSGDASAEAEKAAFLNLAGCLMKRLLIEHSRPLYRRAAKTELHEPVIPRDEGSEAALDVEKALDRLGAIDPRLRTVVEMKVFEGLTGEEIARRMGCGTATVTRCWSFARAWLAREFGGVYGR